jgi:hypothetical protein
VGCPKAAQTSGSQHCQAHGGGRLCQKEGCSKAVTRAPGSVYIADSVYRRNSSLVKRRRLKLRLGSRTPGEPTAGGELVLRGLQARKRNTCALVYERRSRIEHWVVLRGTGLTSRREAGNSRVDTVAFANDGLQSTSITANSCN